MKALQVIALATGLMLMVPAVFAQTKEEHESHHPDATITAPAAVEQESKSAAGMAGMQSMQQNMKTMYELMEKIHSTSDPAEKTQLLKQHMQAMRDQLKDMQGMSGGMMKGMMDGGMEQGAKKQKDGMAMMCGGKKGMKSGDMMMKCHRMMQARMDMMQDMMGQMLEHEEAEQELEHGK